MLESMPRHPRRNPGAPGILRRAAPGLFALVLALAAFSGGARADEYPNQPVNLSLFYPVSTNRNNEVSTNFRLNLIYGDIGAVRGVDLNGLVGRVRRDMVGFQASGLYSHIGGDLRGVSVSGIITFVESDAVGVHFSGLVNFVRGGFKGAQFANLFNYVQGDMLGVQATALFNLNDGDVKYVQLSSIANAVAGDVTGVQAAAGLNYVNENMTGAQAGLFNFAETMRGVQVGLANIAGAAHGVQVGFVNYSDDLDGVPVGVVNVTGGGGADWVTFASTLAAVSTGVRTTTGRLYSFFAIGLGDLKDKRNDTAFLSWHYGYAVPVADRWSIGADLGYLHIMPTPSSDPEVNDKSHFALQGRAIAEAAFSDKFKVFGGGGVSLLYSKYSTDNTSWLDPLVVLGISLF